MDAVATGSSPARGAAFSSQVLILRGLFHLLSCLPLRLLHGLGSAIGWLFLCIPNRRRRIAQINLTLCFPEMSAHTHKRLLRVTLAEFGKSLTETAALWTKDAGEIRRLVQEVVGEQDLDDALDEGKGVILAMPHLGAWEMVSLYCSLLYPFTILYRPPRLAKLEPMMRRARDRLGARLVPANLGGIRALSRALQRREIIGILPDQVPNGEHNAAYADFFGIPAKTMVLLSKLAQQTGAAVVFAYAERLPRGTGYRLRFSRGPRGIEGDDLHMSTALINSEIENQVRQLSAQYQWCYKRFRARPSQERCFYKHPRTIAKRA